ncbi:hypothetical protein C8Q78DRAFT_991857 [Trametes maxima]|nr:hypothetical protein C8Q78DRAFT_991857 [Trametes maxima]
MYSNENFCHANTHQPRRGEVQRAFSIRGMLHGRLGTCACPPSTDDVVERSASKLNDSRDLIPVIGTHRRPTWCKQGEAATRGEDRSYHARLCIWTLRARQGLVTGQSDLDGPGIHHPSGLRRWDGYTTEEYLPRLVVETSRDAVKGSTWWEWAMSGRYD